MAASHRPGVLPVTSATAEPRGRVPPRNAGGWLPTSTSCHLWGQSDLISDSEEQVAGWELGGGVRSEEATGEGGQGCGDELSSPGSFPPPSKGQRHGYGEVSRLRPTESGTRAWPCPTCLRGMGRVCRWAYDFRAVAALSWFQCFIKKGLRWVQQIFVGRGLSSGDSTL